MLHHTNFSFVAGGKSSKIFIFGLWPWDVKGHFEIMSKNTFFPGRVINHLAFGTNRTPLSWLESKLGPFKDKMLRQIPWPRMASTSYHISHWLLKLNVWGGLIWSNIYAEVKPNRKGSVSKWSKFDRFDMEWPKDKAGRDWYVLRRKFCFVFGNLV